MFKSLKVNNGSFAKLGNPQTQPVTDDLGYDVQKQSSKSLSPQGSKLASQASINISTIINDNQSQNVEKGSSLEKIVSNLVSDQNFVLPSLNSKFNSILPSFAKNLEPHTKFDVMFGETLIPKKFEPYERLTGISSERPEIIMMTNFLPIFVKDVGHSSPSHFRLIEDSGVNPLMTPAGRFFNAQVQIKSLKKANITNLIDKLPKTNHVIGNDLFKPKKHGLFGNDLPPFVEKTSVLDEFTIRKEELEKKLSDLKDYATFLTKLTRGIDEIRSYLDLRNAVYSVDPEKSAKNHIIGFGKNNSDNSSHKLVDNVNKNLPPAFTISDTLVRLGYSENSVRHKFASSKVWLQLLLEMKDLLRHHSLEFIDIEPISQRSDTNASGISNINARYFKLNTNVQDLPDVKEITKIQTIVSMTNVLNTLNQAWKNMYQNVHFKSSESNIAVLANMISKELRYSWGLSQKNVQQVLSSYYGYTLQNVGNVELFDYVIGQIGDNISDFIVQDGKNTLVSLSQQKPSEDVAVLTFESKYIDGNSGTLTPGSTFFFDQVLQIDGMKFDTAKLDVLVVLLEKMFKQFGIVVSGLNLLSNVDSDPHGKIVNSLVASISDPSVFVSGILKQLVDKKTGEALPIVSKDNLGSIYSFAVSNDFVKRALFLYTMLRMPIDVKSDTKNSVSFLDNNVDANASSVVNDALVEIIISTIESVVPSIPVKMKQNDPNDKLSSWDLSKETIRSSMKQGTELTKFVELIMARIYFAFKLNDGGMIDGRTRYSAYQETTLMMVAFDMILQLVAKYNNQKIIATSYGTTKSKKNILSFLVFKTIVKHQTSINDLMMRLKRETALTQQVVFSVLHVLDRLNNRTQTFSNYLKSDFAMQHLKEIAGVIANKELLRMFMNEQQIMIFANTIRDLQAKITQSSVIDLAGDVDGDGDFDVSDTIKILDDTVITPKLRNAVYGMLGSDEFTSKKGYNKKILTVGIPLGFTQQLKQRVKLNNKKDVFKEKQKDIVQIVVYRVSVQNSDIIYKPQRFLFELSRFPVRNDAEFKAIPSYPTISDIVNAIPTRDFGQSFEIGSEAQYFAIGNNVSKNSQAAMASDEYSFLSKQQKNELIQNHIFSYLLETYVNTMTGMSVAEHKFDIVVSPRSMDNKFVKMITENYLQQITNISNVAKVVSTGGVLFSATSMKKPRYVPGPRGTTQDEMFPKESSTTGIVGTASGPSRSFLDFSSLKDTNSQKTNSIGSNLQSISHRQVPSFLQGMRVISDISQMTTTLSDVQTVAQRLLRPKQFDRVFNVIVDPDEFDIDYYKTVKTPHGKLALEQMILNGNVVSATENDPAKRHLNKGNHIIPEGIRSFVQGRSAQNVNLFKDRDKDESDLVFDKYFVTIETFGEDEV